MSKRYQPGDTSIASRDLNRFGQAADRVLSNAQGAPVLFNQTNNSTVIEVSNDSGSDVPRFGVLGLGDAKITQSANDVEFYNRVFLSGEEPALGTHDTKFAVALETIKSGKPGRCVVSGLVQCQVTINDDAHEWATITDASVDKLSSAGVGAAKILWKAGTSGDQWAIVHIGPFKSESFWAKITGNAADGNGWTYTWSEQVETPSGWQNKPDGRSGADGLIRNAAEEAGTLGAPIPDGVVTRCWVGVDTNGDTTYRVNLSTAGVLGLVLTQTGGSAGDSTTQCSFTYTVEDMHGNQLGTAVNPTAGVHLWQRPTTGLMLAATSGVGTFETGELVILSINEIPDAEECGGGA